MRKRNKLKRDNRRPQPVMERTDLEIRNLLDDPALRRAMGLDVVAPSQTSVIKRPQRRLMAALSH